jgi:hypothetical protein
VDERVDEPLLVVALVELPLGLVLAGVGRDVTLPARDGVEGGVRAPDDVDDPPDFDPLEPLELLELPELLEPEPDPELLELEEPPRGTAWSNDGLTGGGGVGGIGSTRAPLDVSDPLELELEEPVEAPELGGALPRGTAV